MRGPYKWSVTTPLYYKYQIESQGGAPLHYRDIHWFNAPYIFKYCLKMVTPVLSKVSKCQSIKVESSIHRTSSPSSSASSTAPTSTTASTRRSRSPGERTWRPRSSAAPSSPWTARLSSRGSSRRRTTSSSSSSRTPSRRGRRAIYDTYLFGKEEALCSKLNNVSL